MFRIKIPGGLLHANQLEGLADLVERYAPLKKGHLTTRENIQIHSLTLETAAEAMKILDRIGLSTRDACGNTVRNVICCPMVGLDPQQAFDIQPYLGAYVRNFVQRDFTYNMPRKIKTAFSCGEHDCAVTLMHDIGFIARVQTENGKDRKGFKIVVGGGTSIHPLKAAVVYEFVPVEDFLKVSEAILRVYNNTAWLRKNRMKARIKELIFRDGVESFRHQVDQELTEKWALNYENIDDFMFFDEEQQFIPIPSDDELKENEDDKAFKAWKSNNVIPQLQNGYNFVGVKVYQGDLNTTQYQGLAKIARKYSTHRVRTTPEQNLMFRWVPDSYLYKIYSDLKILGLSDSDMNLITDVTTCPGTDSCKLGITSSMGLGRAVMEAMNDANGRANLLEDPLIKKMHIKASGCPNGCGRHHLADIGFHGGVMKGPTGAQIPAYELFLGGSYENADVSYGIRPRGKVPAKRVDEALFKILSDYKEKRNNGEQFKEFVTRLGKEYFEEIVSSVSQVPKLDKNTIPLYMDFEKTILYKMERGEGECAV